MVLRGIMFRGSAVSVSPVIIGGAVLVAVAVEGVERLEGAESVEVEAAVDLWLKTVSVSA